MNMYRFSVAGLEYEMVVFSRDPSRVRHRPGDTVLVSIKRSGLGDTEYLSEAWIIEDLDGEEYEGLIVGSPLSNLTGEYVVFTNDHVHKVLRLADEDLSADVPQPKDKKYVVEFDTAAIEFSDSADLVDGHVISYKGERVLVVPEGSSLDVNALTTFLNHIAEASQ